MVWMIKICAEDIDDSISFHIVKEKHKLKAERAVFWSIAGKKKGCCMQQKRCMLSMLRATLQHRGVSSFRLYLLIFR
jgi:hypothetical protein